MNIVNHGGLCCGRRHLYGMNDATTASIIALMNQHNLLHEDTNKITEAVVSEENDNLEDLQAALVGAGFVLVAVWDNCSGSRCYMYLHANDWTAYPNGAEVNVAPVLPAPPPREPRDPTVVVLSTYHNFLRAGRSAAGWPTRDEAFAAAPRAVRIDQRNVYASGATRWVEGV